MFLYIYEISTWKALTACSWNVHSLVNSGDTRICWKQYLNSNRSYDSMDQKLDLLVGELQRYSVPVGGIQETKWFGVDVWPAANGYTLLHSLLLLMMVWLRERV